MHAEVGALLGGRQRDGADLGGDRRLAAAAPCALEARPPRRIALPQGSRLLEAYEHAADAFTTTAEERRAEPMSWWVKRIGSRDGLTQAYGAWDKEVLVGSVALEFSSKPKTRHSALLLGMYVRPTYRGRDVGKELLQAVAQAAAERPEVRTLALTLTEGNGAALRLYMAAGFDVWGVEPLAIKTTAGYKGTLSEQQARSALDHLTIEAFDIEDGYRVSGREVTRWHAFGFAARKAAAAL